jgi:hypothetical protein
MKHRKDVGVKCTFYSHNTLYIIVTTEHIAVNSARNRHPLTMNRVLHSSFRCGCSIATTVTRIYVSFGRPSCKCSNGGAEVIHECSTLYIRSEDRDLNPEFRNSSDTKQGF